MLQGKDWNNFFNNIDNKTDLLKLLVMFFTEESFWKKLNDETVIMNDRSNTLKISTDGIEAYFPCNHEEADSRLILHAIREDTPVVIISKDTDVFILMLYAFAKIAPNEDWFMKIDTEKYVSIRKIVNCLGTDICEMLPHFHAVTGCDTTSYLHGVGKVKVFKKIESQNELLKLLDGLGNSSRISDNLEEKSKQFVQCVCYSGRKDEGLVETRVRLYRKMKVKSSVSLPPDPDSLKYHLFRVNYQLFEWIRFANAMLEERDLKDSGWKTNQGQIKPIWFEGNSFFLQ